MSIDGTSGADTLTGTSSADVFNAYGGADVIYGYGGADDIYAGDGADYLIGGDGNDWMEGQNGFDYLNGGAGDDKMYGGIGDDVFEYGTNNGVGGLNNGWDEIYGGDGTDDQIHIYTTSGYVWTAVQLTAMSGIESIENYSGGPGYINVNGNIDFFGVNMLNIHDIIGYNATQDVIGGSDSYGDTIHAGDGNDIISGNGGTDTLHGENGSDQLFGGAGNDTLYGGDAPDWLTGGAGNDDLYSGAGSDWLKYASGDGSDTVHDFVNGSDRFDVRGTTANSMADVTVTASGSDTIIAFDDIQITLIGISTSAINSSDFLF